MNLPAAHRVEYPVIGGIFRLPEIPWWERMWISPQSQILSSCLTLGVGISNPICGGLLSLIFFVMPGHAGADLFKIDVIAVEQHLAQYPLITVEIMAFDRKAYATETGRVTY